MWPYSRQGFKVQLCRHIHISRKESLIFPASIYHSWSAGKYDTLEPMASMEEMCITHSIHEQAFYMLCETKTEKKDIGVVGSCRQKTPTLTVTTAQMLFFCLHSDCLARPQGWETDSSHSYNLICVKYCSQPYINSIAHCSVYKATFHSIWGFSEVLFPYPHCVTWLSSLDNKLAENKLSHNLFSSHCIYIYQMRTIAGDFKVNVLNQS